MSSRKEVEIILLAIVSSLQSIKIYTIDHPKAMNAVDVAYGLLTKYGQENGDLELGLVNKEFFFKKEIFFHLTDRLSLLADLFGRVGIQQICFNKNLLRTEFVDFYRVLLSCEENQSFSQALTKSRISLSTIETGLIGGSRLETSQIKNEQEVESLVTTEYYELGSLCGDLIDKNKQTIENIVDINKEIDIEAVKDFSCDIFNMMVANKKSLFAMIGLKQHDDYTFVHSLNVSALSMYQGQYLGLSEKDVIRLGMSGFFHDKGKQDVKKQLLNKKGKLSDEEFEAVKSHTILGAEQMLKEADFDKLFFITAFQHHVGVNLGRYPKVNFLRRQNLAAQIVAISDVYDALRSRRSYKKGMSLETVHEIMQKEKGTLLNSDLVDLFFSNVGVWPIATLVCLNSGEVGIVKEINVEDVFSPVVEIFYDSSNNRLGSTEIFDLSEKNSKNEYKYRIKNHIVPDSEDGQKYVNELYR